MQFIKLKIGSNNLSNQKWFYGDLLGFHTSELNNEELLITAGKTNLILSKKIVEPELYHFAFLIPTGSLESAIYFLENKGVELLCHHRDKIIHFDTGRSIYFFDRDGNIGEFIERPLLPIAQKSTFEINDIICLNEIGLPVENPAKTSQKLIQHGIQPIDINGFRDNFCWVGNHEGAMIVVKEGRHWLPTQISGVSNDFELDYIENDTHFSIRFINGKLILK